MAGNAWSKCDASLAIEAALGNYMQKRHKKKLSDIVGTAASLGDDNHGDLAPPAKRRCLD